MWPLATCSPPFWGLKAHDLNNILWGITIPVQVRGIASASWHITFLRWGVFSTSTNPQAGWPPLAGFPRLLIQCIHITLHTGGRLLHLKPADAPFRDYRCPLSWQGNLHWILRFQLNGLQIPVVTNCKIKNELWNNSFLRSWQSATSNPGLLISLITRMFYSFFLLSYSNFCLPIQVRCRGLLYIRSHTVTPPQSVGLLWTKDRPVAETSAWQHTTLTTD